MLTFQYVRLVHLMALVFLPLKFVAFTPFVGAPFLLFLFLFLFFFHVLQTGLEPALERSFKDLASANWATGARFHVHIHVPKV